MPNMQTIYRTDRLYRITGKLLWIDVFCFDLFLLRVRMREQLFISRLIRNFRVGLFGWMDGWMEYMQMRRE